MLNNETSFNTKIKKHLTLVLAMIGTGTVLASGILALLPVQEALSDHTPDDVVCPVTTCVGSADIATGAVTTAKIATGAVGTAKIATGGVTSIDIATGGVTSADIATGGVTSIDIADGGVALADLAASSVDSSKIVDGSIIKGDVSTSFIRTIKYFDDAAGNAAGWNPDGVTTNFIILSGNPTNNDSIILTSMNNAGFFGLGTFTQGCYVYNWGVDAAGTGAFDFKCVNAPPGGSELNVAVINQ